MDEVDAEEEAPPAAQYSMNGSPLADTFVSPGADTFVGPGLLGSLSVVLEASGTGASAATWLASAAFLPSCSLVLSASESGRSRFDGGPLENNCTRLSSSRTSCASLLGSGLRKPCRLALVREDTGPDKSMPCIGPLRPSVGCAGGTALFLYGEKRRASRPSAERRCDLPPEPPCMGALSSPGGTTTERLATRPRRGRSMV